MSHPDWYIGLALACFDVCLFLAVIFGLLTFSAWIIDKIAHLVKLHGAFIDFICDHYRGRWWGSRKP